MLAKLCSVQVMSCVQIMNKLSSLSISSSETGKKILIKIYKEQAEILNISPTGKTT